MSRDVVLAPARIHTVEGAKITLISMPTEDEIDEARTANGGWTKDQLAEWGVSWPPPRGWKEGLEVTLE